MKFKAITNTPEVQEARKLAHQACDLSWELAYLPKDRLVKRLRGKAIARANRRLDKWQKLMEG